MKILIFLAGFTFMAYGHNNRELSESELTSAEWEFNLCLSTCEKDSFITVFCANSCLKLTQKKHKIQLADYSTCMYACQRDGGCADECHAVCRRE